ncbi:hypothetical protein BAUCODRAFT_74895 [Baudoinia panamericana UAMH 10762]|uniref:Major facilitator superfamily (MFS) profile domain-containing protein n=1 Tax=Baudoinia panamericana (strain UAMH 10762) TaxID=717646 RepID=M2LI70_BAUPA|nr:uncharacterized protein BAUCODRAFT_74895 [Baudoinia panamericana UAMH 10762]EMC93882.1 hypothetical protein BAUCODRAFT_74895 [Baudoinia panamericana UAMH 10762]
MTVAGCTKAEDSNVTTGPYNLESSCDNEKELKATSISVADCELGPASLSSPTDSDSEDRVEDDAASISNQRELLSNSRLMVAFPALAIALFVSFIDQTSVSTSIPAISKQLNTGASTSWISASFLIASTAFQLINGRLSDIFGRKKCLIVCLALLGLGDLLCGFARTKEQMFAFRALAGIGGGGVNSIVMIIVSDITTLQTRGKYQGILGAVMALANGTGPFIGGVLVQRASWRWTFFLVPMLALPVTVIIAVALPLKHDKGNHIEKLKKIDYGGVALNIAGTLLVLIPLSGGGVTYAWHSAFFIAMFTSGALVCVAFVLYEWRLAPIPIMPVRLWQSVPCTSLYAQSFFSGICFFGNFFYIPIYLQNVKRYSPIISGALILPLIISTSIFSILAGLYMARSGRYLSSVATGFSVWTLAAGFTITFSKHSHLWAIIIVLLVEGAGIGLTLQPTLIGLLANSREEDRAVCTGLRNFVRTIGGAFGLILSGVILSNTLSTNLKGDTYVSDQMLTTLTSSIDSIEQAGLTDVQKDRILDVYMQGMHYIFIFYTCSIAVNVLLNLGIGNTNLTARGKLKPQDEQSSQERTSGSAAVEEN